MGKVTDLVANEYVVHAKPSLIACPDTDGKPLGAKSLCFAMRAHENVNSVIVTRRESVLYDAAAHSSNFKDCPERNPAGRRNCNSRFWHDATRGRPP